MFNYPIEKYQFYTTKNKVVAVSTYAGKTVRGIAKADPRDNFDLEAGKKLAAARCAARIAMKRKSRAQKEFDKARDHRGRYRRKRRIYRRSFRKSRPLCRETCQGDGCGL